MNLNETVIFESLNFDPDEISYKTNSILFNINTEKDTVYNVKIKSTLPKFSWVEVTDSDDKLLCKVNGDLSEFVNINYVKIRNVEFESRIYEIFLSPGYYANNWDVYFGPGRATKQDLQVFSECTDCIKFRFYYSDLTKLSKNIECQLIVSFVKKK
jgi:hypothetical protein